MQGVGSIREVAAKGKELVDEVNSGSQHGAAEITRVAQSLSQIRQVARQTAASADETALASVQMSSQADAMRGMAAELQSLIGGGK